MEKFTKSNYKDMVDKKEVNKKIVPHAIAAFLVGGLICTIAEVINNILIYFKIENEAASTWTVIIMVFLGAFFTGLGMYDKWARHAGAGTIVPITGFSNSISSAAIEFKSEGYILGVGAKIFLIAGPVIAYGVATSIVIGLIYYFFSR
ncbi:MAG: stage V sporulation protein AC [Oscillospiraceae bacterium]|nr:stage V sporulation protein AC [Oscillospiraceae bacterium]